MIIVDGKEKLLENLNRQLSIYWKDTYNWEYICKSVDNAILRLAYILENLSKNNKYAWSGDETVFSPYNSVEYAIFLYLTSHSLALKKECSKEADMLYYLNKIMNNCDWYCAIELPELFYAEHPIGSVMGRAKYGNNFFFYQGTTVGGQRNNDNLLVYPQIGNNVLMYANSSIIGNSIIGNNVIISMDCTVRNEVVPDNCIVFGKTPNLIIKKKSEGEILTLFGNIWEKYDE